MTAFREACAARGLISAEDCLRRAAVREVVSHGLQVTYCDDSRVIVRLDLQTEALHFSVEGNRLERCDRSGTVR